MLFSSIEWPLGQLLLVSDGESLTGIYFDGGRAIVHPQPDWRRADSLEPLAETRRQLTEYWNGSRKSFDLPLRPLGTAFQRQVWRCIGDVPLGETITYRELAIRSGSPHGSRAAGLATGRNPLSIVIPCHRIIGTNGSLTGFGGGLDRKRALLDFEAAMARGTRCRLEPRRSLIQEAERPCLTS